MATGTLLEVVMPQMGVSVSEGTVTRWLRNVGDTVGADESLLEVSTDKVDTEVPSPGRGVLQEILVAEGETVAVGTVLARIGEAPPARPAPALPPPEPAPRAETEPPAEPAAASELRADPSSLGPPLHRAGDRRVSPLLHLARRRAYRGRAWDRPLDDRGKRPRRARDEEGSARAGRDASACGSRASSRGWAVATGFSRGRSGTGAASGRHTGSPPATSAAAASSRTSDPHTAARHTARSRTAARHTSRRHTPPTAPHRRAATPPAATPPAGAAAPQTPEPDEGEALGAGESLEPMSIMRRGIAEHMRRSLDTAAHVTSAIEVDMSKVAGDP